MDKLQRYKAKRNFEITPEPSGPGTGGQGLRFVVQKHAARRLHYDFRLELDGTLKSWAVPKGPSLDPADKRMAVEVEDHPIPYADFEGVIPPKQYGAGTVIVWDNGTWTPTSDARQGLAAGRLKFELHGHKLRGHWTLVRMHGRGGEKQTPWLLIKERDGEARAAADYSVVDAEPDSVLTPAGPAGTKQPQTQPAAKKKAGARKAASKAATQHQAADPALPDGAEPATLPLTLSPQLATLVDRPPSGDTWHYELKFDGYRLLARIDEQGGVRLFTRNGNDWTSKLKSLAKQVAQLGITGAWLDGEIVVAGEHGAPDFQQLQNAFESSKTDRIDYYVFDLPYVDGHDLRSVPLAERRTLLRQRLQAVPAEQVPRVRFSEDFAVPPGELLHTACELRMEGLIGKRGDAPYTSSRSADWIKLKCTQRQEFVIGGFTEPQGSRAGLGALLLGVHGPGGALRYAGKVGTGFDQAGLVALRAKLDDLLTDRMPFDPKPPAAEVRGAHWVRPRLVCEVSFGQWTREGRIRHSVFHGLRSDKEAGAVTREQPVAASKVATKVAKTVVAKKVVAKKAASKATTKETASPTKTTRTATPAWPEGVRLSHASRVIDASSGVTKQELAQYYLQASRLMLPHLQRRPVALVRAPDGLAGELFFQKHGQQLKIPGIQLLDPAFDPGHPPLLEVANLQALIGSVQMNVIEFHTWNGSTRAIDQPDRMTFDLDPGEGVPWQRLQEAAQLVRALLQELELQSFLKTSGGKGLHVMVPIKPALGWDAVKGLSQRIVQHLAQTLPDRFVAKSGPRNRVGKIFVDYLRNGRGATTAAAWSARSRPGLGVSVPVRWEELDGLTGGAHWTVRTAAERFTLDDPWPGHAVAAKQGIKAAMQALDYVPPAA